MSTETGKVPARSSALAINTWRHLNNAVISDMLEAGEDASDDKLYQVRLAEAVAAFRRKLLEMGQ